MTFAISYPSGAIFKDGVQQTDLAEYVAFLRDGGSPIVISDQSPRYIEVNPWQLGQALEHFGLLSQVQAAAEASQDPLVRFGWARASTFASDEPLTIGFAAAIGITRDQLQQVFEYAEGL